MADIKWQYIRGMTRPDGLTIWVYSTRKFTFCSPEHVEFLYDQGKVGPGDFKYVPDKYEYTEVSVRNDLAEV